MKRFPFSDLSVEAEEGGGAAEMKNRGGDSAPPRPWIVKEEASYEFNRQNIVFPPIIFTLQIFFFLFLKKNLNHFILKKY